MAFDFSTLVTDRSPEDLQALRDLLATPMADWTAEQLAAFNRAASKGAYNYTDLNRVIAAMDDLNERLTAAGYVTAYHPIIVHPATPPEPVGPLPDGYTQLEYIESTGTQYINTGLNPTQDFAISLRALTSQTGSYTMVGSDISWTGNGFSIGVSFAHYGSQTLDPINVYNDGNEHEITLTNNVLASDGVNIHTFSLQTFSINYPIFLFANNRAGSPQEHTTMRLWSAKIMAGETDLMVLVPCKNPSGDVGLYDLENHQFYGNSGTGVFTSGPESPQPEPEPTLDPYIWYEADVPTVSLMDEYLANVAALRAVLSLPETTPEVPADMDRLTQSEANAIEAVLDIINTYLLALQSIFRRCGAVVCGGPELYFVN